MTKKLTTGVLAIAIALVATFSVAPSANADCSYNGWKSSKGKCEVSWKTPRYQYNASYYGYSSQQAFLEAYIRQLQDLLRQLQQQHNYDYDYDYGDNDADVNVATRAATNLDDDSATLRGTLDFDGEDEATVFFQYGRTQSLGNSTSMMVLDEEDDEEEFSQGITGLREDTTYYFRAVAEDEDGDRDYGSILSFRTDDEDNDDDDDDNDGDAPEAETDEADEVEETTAELNGDVDMNDFENGVVFFAYGEDEDQVDDVADDFVSYGDVEEDGDNLQVVLMDSDLDGSENFSTDITGLDRDTEHFYAMCVAYEDEDDDEVIVCGDTESFTTDN